MSIPDIWKSKKRREEIYKWVRYYYDKDRKDKNGNKNDLTG